MRVLGFSGSSGGDVRNGERERERERERASERGFYTGEHALQMAGKWEENVRRE